MNNLPLKLYGSVGSPYSRKMLSIMRYRRIPYLWIYRDSKDDVDMPKLPVNLLPALRFPGENGDYQEAMIDSTSARIAHTEACRVVAWMDVMEDLSGPEVCEEDWMSRETIPDSLFAILNEIGAIYPQFLMANDAALKNGDKQFECDIYGRKWVQPSVAYQRKCLNWLREAYQNLGQDDHAAVDKIMAGTGCERLFN
jgi:glutathione S-transferase-like protein